MQVQKFASPLSGSEPPDMQRLAVAPALLRLRTLSRCKPLFGRSVLRIRGRGRSLGSPSGLHGRRELRTTLWGQIEFSLHFFGSNWSLNSSRLYSGFSCHASVFLFGSTGSLHPLASFISPDGRFPFFLSRAGCRCRFEFLFQLCELLRTFLQASFQTPDFLTKILRLHMGSTLLPPVADTTSAGYRVNDKNLLMSRHITAPSRSAYTGSVARK